MNIIIKTGCMEKEQKRNETKEKRPLTEEQRQRRKKMLVYPLMVLTFLGCMWLIFAPSQKDGGKERQGLGFNTDMPLPENSGIIGDKAKAYEQQQLENRKEGTPGHGGRTCPHSGTTRTEGTDTADGTDDCRLAQPETSPKTGGSGIQTGIRSSLPPTSG